MTNEPEAGAPQCGWDLDAYARRSVNSGGPRVTKEVADRRRPRAPGCAEAPVPSRVPLGSPTRGESLAAKEESPEEALITSSTLRGTYWGPDVSVGAPPDRPEAPAGAMTINPAAFTLAVLIRDVGDVRR